MTYQEREQIKQIKELIESVFYWDNKNLLKRQFYKLDSALELLEDMTKPSKYQEHKEEARAKAQALQVYEGAMSWEDVAKQGAELERLGKRYGLLKEFRREGVL